MYYFISGQLKENVEVLYKKSGKNGADVELQWWYKITLKNAALLIRSTHWQIQVGEQISDGDGETYTCQTSKKNSCLSSSFVPSECHRLKFMSGATLSMLSNCATICWNRDCYFTTKFQQLTFKSTLVSNELLDGNFVYKVERVSAQFLMHSFSKVIQSFICPNEEQLEPLF